MMFQENLASKQLADIIHSLQKLAECPVCLETSSSPARQCVHGHVTCASCARQLSECSLCEKPFLDESPVFVNNLLEALPRFCRYAEEGCKEVHVPSAEHEEFCEFRSISCREAVCNTKVNVCKMREHYRNKHSSQVVIDRHNNEISTKNVTANTDQFEDIPVFLNGNFFYLRRIFLAYENHLRFTVEASFVGKPKQEHFICISLTKGSFQFSKTIKPIVMKADEDSSGFETLPETDKGTEEYHMQISRASLLRVLDEDKLHWTVNFIKS